MPERPLRAAGAYALVAAMLGGLLAGAILIGPYRAIERSDYMTYHLAARLVLQGRGACLYDAACQADAQRQLIGEEPSFEGRTLPYNSPPWLALVTVPFGLLPLQLGYALFVALSLGALAAVTWRLAWGSSATRLVATVLVLSAWPTVMAVIRGQSTLAAVALLGASVAASTFRSGAALGFAALKPTLVPVWAAWQLVGRHWRAVGTAVAVLLLLVLASALLVSPQAVLAYPGHLLGVAADAAPAGVHPQEMINWRGIAIRLGADGWLVAAGSILTLALVAVTWWRSDSRRIGAAAAFLATPVVIPHANQHEFVLAAVGVLLALSAAPTNLRGRLTAGAIGLHALLWAGPVLDAQVAAWLLFVLELGLLAAVGWLSTQRADAGR